MPRSLGAPDAKVRAFTLIEILTVVSILAVLTSLLIGLGQHANEKARTANAKAELAVLAASLESYCLKYGDYPQTDDAATMLQSLIGRRGPAGFQITDRAVLQLARFTTKASTDPFSRTDAVLIDPWSRPYEYRYHAGTSGLPPSFLLYSSGPDGLSTDVAANAVIDFSAPENLDNLYANR